MVMMVPLALLAALACSDKVEDSGGADTAISGDDDGGSGGDTGGSTDDTGPSGDDTGGGGGDSGDPGGSGYDEERFAELAALLDSERSALGAPGLAFAVFEGGEVVWARGFGDRHPEGTGGPVEATTLFRIGSMNKMLTAAGLLQQVEAGALALDAPVTDALPEFVFAYDETWGESVLVEHTLTHQGAFYDYLELDAGADDDLLYDFMTTTFVDYLWLMAPPGSMWNYSNPNFYLAGLLTEQVSGQYYREYMDAQVFTPLGMDRTFFLGEEVLADGDYASGDTYNWTTGIGRAVAAPDSYDNAWGRPAGFAWSSVLDMAAFARFLLDGDPTVLSDALRQEMMSPQVDVQYGIPLDYGYGLFINEGFFIGEDWYDLTLVSHGGDIPGFAADMYFIPELNAGFVALASTDYAHLGESAVAALELIGLPEPGTAPEISVDTATFPDFAGEYMDPWNVGPMTVTTDGSSVIIEMPLLDDYGISYEPELYPYTPDNFLITVDGYTLVMTFLRDDGGDVQYARTRPFVLEVVDEAAPPPPPSSLALDTDRLRASLEAAASADARQLRWVPPERVGVRAARR